MGSKKLWQKIKEMIIKGIREIAPIMAVIPETCKFCGSKRIVRYGHYHMVQRWWCKDCKRKFVYNEALPGMKTPVIQVASALSSFYEGTPIRGIRRNIEQTFGNYPQNAAIYSWIQRFTKAAIEIAKDYKPEVGDTWIADETVLKIGGENVWFWDIIDKKTRFLLASKMSKTRTIRMARALMEQAAERAGKAPEAVVTDKLNVYLDGIELAFGSDTKHKQGSPFNLEKNTNLIERFHGTLKARTKIMKGLQTQKSAELILGGWLVFYNFLRPHEGLKGKTPAEKAGIKFPFKNWLDLIKESKRDYG